MQIHRCSIDCFHPSEREIQYIELVSQGMSNRRIAARLGLRPPTVKNQMSVLYRRLDVADRASLVRKAYELGLLTVDAHDASAAA